MRQLCLILFLIVLMIAASNAQSKGGRWQFENNGADSATWDNIENTGTLIDTALYTYVPPLAEGATYLWLDSAYSNNFMKIEDSDDLDFTDENIGLSAWINPILLNSAHFFISKGYQNTNPKTTNYSLRVSKAGKLEFLIRDSGNQAQKVESSFTIPLNEWTFVAAYYDFDAHLVYMWDDPASAPVDTLEFNQSIFANDGPLGIGAWNNTDGTSIANFKGRIDDVRISGREEDIIPDAITSSKYLQLNTVSSFHLKQNYPNPFNPETVISFNLSQPEYISLKVYDNQGRIVDTILEQKLVAGSHQYIWNAGRLASGVYFYQIKSSAFSQTKKMLLMK
jgi:Concanavalin A-like lectin/glucanases superfamily/Secretion system C-terminal sorting domain